MVIGIILRAKFACPDCRKKYFKLKGLNEHYSKMHRSKTGFRYARDMLLPKHTGRRKKIRALSGK